MAEKNTTAVAVKPERASALLADGLKMDQGTMIQVIKAQCFASSDPSRISNEQLAAYINVATGLKAQAPNFNPILPGMLYAFPTKNGGIQPMIGPDGVFALLSSRPDIEGWNCTCTFDQNGVLVSATATVHVRGMHPIVKTCYLAEWKVDSNPNWKARPCHMLELRALKQAARQVIHGLPLDREEAEIIGGEVETVAKREVPVGVSKFRRVAPPAEVVSASVDVEPTPEPSSEGEASSEAQEAEGVDLFGVDE
jgi:hypothetical protein